MSHLFVRVRMTANQILPIMPKILNVCSQVIAYEHAEKRENIHIHMILIDCQVSTDTLKNYIRKTGLVPVGDSKQKGNAFWSFKSAYEPLGAMTYMSKGKHEPFVNKGFTQEVIDECKGKWEERSPETSTSVKKPSGPTQYEMAMEVVDLLGPRNDDRHTIELYTEIVKLSIKVHHKYRKGFCEYSLRKVVHTAYTRYEVGKTQFVEKLVHNFFYK